MDINYYDEHQEEFEAVKLALRAKWRGSGAPC
nr:hypothetical protein EIAKOHGP_00021 [Enterobacter hormaechei subsp. steigerwaltii]WOL81072.1 hypothetical protein FOAFALDK_00021 [Klebsiella pneumoniae]WOL81214.1 hypothetical protein LIPCDGPM_00021 [Klebsiella pneumoniae]WOL82000.1 hypothetical protein FLAHDHLM_00022 [Klebsiella pneumoniae]WOL82238.1 hypothetical protein INNAACCF_00021 [Klebsiella pneumoniae]